MCPPPSLRRDSRGAVLVLGLLMCAVLVGVLWYVVGVGDVVWFRERAQEAADAAAFSGAVADARAMNLLVLVNVVMASILAIRVMLKVLQIALVIAEVIAVAVAAITLGAVDFVPVVTDAQETVTATLTRTRPLINDAIKGLHAAANGVAKGAPYVAYNVGRSVAATLDDPSESLLRPQDRVIDATGALSVVLPRDLFELGSGATKALHGLPVEDDDPEVLCAQAGHAVAGFVDQFLRAIHLDGLQRVSDFLLGWIEPVARSANGYFCENGAAGSAPDALPLDGLDSIATDSCNQKKKQHDDEGGKTPFDLEKCKKDFAKDAQAKANGAARDGQASAERLVSLRLRRSFVNGGPDAQVIAHVALRTDERTILGEGARGVAIAGFGRRKVEALGASSGSAVAQAEYYYDDGGPWSALQADAMWNFRWRARLRRVSTGDALGRSIEAALTTEARLDLARGMGAPSLEAAAAEAKVIELEARPSLVVH